MTKYISEKGLTTLNRCKLTTTPHCYPNGGAVIVDEKSGAELVHGVYKGVNVDGNELLVIYRVTEDSELGTFNEVIVIDLANSTELIVYDRDNIVVTELLLQISD